ncbi:MAG: 4Fe-4S binding protein [Candidatus Margulisiibacteriota bacterium]
MAGTKKQKSSVEPLHIFSRACRGCGICIAFCPHKVLEFDLYGIPKAVHPEKCKNCLICDILCPDFAITGMRKRKTHS